jgi:uncharacterized repeat protein (TIGR01451 family)
MRKVGNLTRLVDVVEPDQAARGRDGRSLRMVLVGMFALAVALVAVAISGAAPGTDADVKEFDQCANGAPPSTATDCPEKWINGILNANNSHYAEDEVTPQRVVLELPKNSPTTGRTVEISFLTRKGGVHAYDSLATWNHTQTSADRCGANLNAAYCLPGPATTFPIPPDPTVVADNNGSGSATSGHQLGGQVFTMYGGTITAASAYTHDDPGGSSDSYAHITLTYSVPSTANATNVMLLFGGHIAASLGPRGWGIGIGAGSISGGPYHIRITAADGASVGNRDNQIMSGAILAPANLLIEKVAVGGNATFNYTSTGGLSPASFPIATSGGTGSQSFTNIAAGSYTVTESAPPAGWDFTSLQCVDEDGNSSANGMTSNIVLAAGETATCTYTNTLRGSIVVDKVTAPSGDPQSFPFTLTGGPDSINQGFSLTDAAAPHNSGLVKPGTYAAAETSVPAGWDLTSATCSDGSSPGSISLGAGETVTCTFTNTKRATLVVYKQVVNNNGGSAVSSNWTMNVSGPTSLNFAGSATGTSNPVLSGSYTVGESGPSGYALTYPTTGLPAGVAQNDCNAQGAVSIGPGETKRCVLRNDDRPGTLTVIKHVINDNGGTKLAGDFPITVTGNGPNPANFAGAESPGTDVAIGAGAYDVTEIEDPGYTASYSAGCTGSIALGQSKTCTITNDDKAASLTVVKHVINDDGGTKTAAQFPISVTGNAPNPASFPGAELPGTPVAIGPGAYDVTEIEDPGYTASYSAGCSGSIALGQSKTCTITNNDKAASLTVIKDVVNDNGGTKVAGDFPITVTGSAPDPANFPGEEAPGTSVGIGPGSYDVTEVEDPGYTASYSAGCSGSIALGQSKICTITNNDKAPSLTLVKEVVNNNGGAAVPSDWVLSADGPTGFSGPGPSVGSGAGFDAGSYDLSEAGPAGYDASDWSCTDGQADADTVEVALGDDITCTITNDDQPASLTVVKHVINDNGGTLTASQFPITVTGSNPSPANFPGAEAPGTQVVIGPGAYDVTEIEDPGYTAYYSAGCTGSIALGESKTCTITNNDKAPSLTLVKEVVNDNGGKALPSSWTLTADGPTGFSGLGPSVSSGPGFDQGSYDLSESGPAGYDASDWDCTGESQVDADTVVVGLGDDVTCTIVNDDRAAALIVRKVVVNDNGGTKQAQDFSFRVNLGAAQPFEADGQNDLVVAAGTYNVTEPAVAGYTTSYSNCSNLVIPNGGSATCTITNNDVPRGQGSITVSKSANPTTLQEPGGPVTFSVTITNTSVDVPVAIDNVFDDKFGDLDDNGGNGCFDVPVNLAPGEKVNCTFERTITGAGGTSHVNTVTATGVDPAGNRLTASDDARVDITPRLIDLVIVKEASSPTPLNGIVNYSLSVTNRGPETATNVQIADPAPAGITYLTATPSQGTCNLGPSLVTCSLGTIAPGQTVTIAITARATTVGQHTNTATVTGSGGRETNPADNVDSAVTVVPAPLRPPTVKPTPKPTFCLALAVSPQMIKADGKPDRVSVRVTAGQKRMKGVRVVVQGAGVRKSATSNGKGLAVLRINARKAGIITITAQEPNQKVCGLKRIGVVGVFLPPLTG